jgi:hypothetical protein
MASRLERRGIPALELMSFEFDDHRDQVVFVGAQRDL